MKEPLDEATYQQVASRVAWARTQGRDWVEALHDADLLLSPAAARTIQLGTLRRFGDRLSQLRPAELLARVGASGSATPADMYRAIGQYLEQYIEALRREP